MWRDYSSASPTPKASYSDSCYCLRTDWQRKLENIWIQLWAARSPLHCRFETWPLVLFSRVSSARCRLLFYFFDNQNVREKLHAIDRYGDRRRLLAPIAAGFAVTNGRNFSFSFRGSEVYILCGYCTEVNWLSCRRVLCFHSIDIYGVEVHSLWKSTGAAIADFRLTNCLHRGSNLWFFTGW